MRYAKAPVVRFHDGNTDGDYDGGTQEGDNTLYYTHDANWNTTAVVDGATGAVAERYFYDAYGQAHFCNPSTWAEIQWSGSLQNEILYGGYGLDAESGLYHTDYREYHCSLGRWTAQDPIPYPDGMNLYQYCCSSPVLCTDPAGLDPDWQKFTAGIFGAFAGAMEILGSGAANSIPVRDTLLYKGCADMAAGITLAVAGLMGQPGLGPAPSAVQAVSDLVTTAVSGRPSVASPHISSVFFQFLIARGPFCWYRGICAIPRPNKKGRSR